VARAFAVGNLIWPRFEEVRGCVLLADRHTVASVDKWWEQLHGDRVRIEGVLNHPHLWDGQFSTDEDDENSEGFVELARLMQAGWRGAPASEFPGRSFEVTCTGLSANDPEYGPTLTFYSSRVRQST
jgi:hypothetical protein